MFRAEFVETLNKKRPFNDLIQELNITEQTDIFAAINKLCDLKNHKNIIPSNFSKYVKEGIFELKVHHRVKITRCFYFYFIDQRIVFTHGFIKKTNKIPIKEIEKAIKLKNEFQLITEK